MKKAKEYAEQILSCKDEGALTLAINDTFHGLVQEMHDIGNARKIQTDKALKAIILEQKQKWRAICRIVNREHVVMNEDGFIQLLEEAIPMTKILLSYD